MWSFALAHMDGLLYKGVTGNWEGTPGHLTRQSTSTYTQHTHTHTQGPRITRGGEAHLPQPRGLVQDVIRQQDDHAEVLSLVGQFQHLALKVLDVAKPKLLLLIHHFH